MFKDTPDGHTPFHGDSDGIEVKHFTHITINDTKYKLVQEVEEQPKKDWKRWRAEEDGEYWCVNPKGEVVKFYEKDDRFDDYQYLTGNYFQTREEAEHHKARQEAIGRVTHAIIEANEGWVPDWEDVREEKYYLYYNYPTQNIDYDWMSSYRLTLQLPYIKSAEIAEKIKCSHEQDLLLIFNVKKK